MLKRILGGIILVPVIILFSFWGVNFVCGVMSGEINLVTFIAEHRLIIAIAVTYLVFKFVNPFKK